VSPDGAAATTLHQDNGISTHLERDDDNHKDNGKDNDKDISAVQ
jgi:hypothetical protein